MRFTPRIAPRANLSGTLGDRWGAETSPAGTPGSYENVAEAIVPGSGIASIIRETGDVIGALSQLVNDVRITQQQRAALQIQLARAQQGLPPAPVQPSSTGLFGMSQQQTLLLGALGVAAYMLMSGRSGKLGAM